MTDRGLMAVLLALQLVTITGSAGQKIEINPELVTGLRDVRGSDRFPPNVHCAIFTVDGRIFGSQENCDVVKRVLQQSPKA